MSTGRGRAKPLSFFLLYSSHVVDYAGASFLKIREYMRSSRSSLWNILILAALAGLVYWFLAENLPQSMHGADFRAYYNAGSLIAGGHFDQLYDIPTHNALLRAHHSTLGEMPFLAPAATALVFAPLACLPYHTAYMLLLGINLLLLPVAAWSISRAFPSPNKLRPFLILTLLTCSPTTLSALLNGQLSIVLLLAFVLAMRATHGGNNLKAGLISAIFLLKPQFFAVVPFVGLAAKSRSRYTAGFSLGLLLCMFVQGGICHDPLFIDYAYYLSKTQHTLQPTQSTNMFSSYAALQSLLPETSPLAILICSGMLSIVLFFLVYYRGKSRGAVVFLAPLAANTAAIHTFPHDATLSITATAYLLCHQAPQQLLARTLGLFIWILPWLHIYLQRGWLVCAGYIFTFALVHNVNINAARPPQKEG